jgi:fatty-acyl-CoA synthase
MVLLDRFLKAPALVRILEEERVTFANGVPTIWNDVLGLLRREPGHDLSSLRRIVIGGAAVSRTLLEAFDTDVGAPILQGWGMTETSPLVTVARPPRDADPEAALSARVSQGRVLAGVDIRLVDPDTLEVLAPDGETVGELELRGPWISGGYLAEEGGDKFHDGWLRTGDVGTLDPSGYVRLTDRVKDVIKSGGEWISSVELEDALIGHPGIQEVCVIGVPDARWDERPCAVVVATEGAGLDPAELRRWLVGRVARWWIPERWAVVDELPRTSVGKYDKRVLRSQYAAEELPVVEVSARLPQ